MYEEYRDGGVAADESVGKMQEFVDQKKESVYEARRTSLQFPEQVCELCRVLRS